MDKISTDNDTHQVSWLQCESSNIKGIAYCFQCMNLYIKFNTDRTYVYRGVPLNKFGMFASAPSLGRFARRIVKEYEYEEVTIK